MAGATGIVGRATTEVLAGINLSFEYIYIGLGGYI